MDNIWTYQGNEAVDVPDIEPKQFKTTQNFYDDLENLCRDKGIKMHPALKKPLPKEPEEGAPPADPAAKPKEITTLNFYKHRLDKSTLKILFFLLPYYPTIHTLK